MAHTPHFLGVDPGLAHFGWGLVDVSGSKFEVVSAGCIVTEKSDKKRKVLSADDNVRRAQQLARALERIITFSGSSVRLICAESMSMPRHSSSAGKLAMSWGVVAALSAFHGIPLVQASPQEIKIATAGKKSASKEEVQAAVCRELPGAEAVVSKAVSRAADLEHPYDALAAVWACRHSQLAIAMARDFEV